MSCKRIKEFTSHWLMNLGWNSTCSILFLFNGNYVGDFRSQTFDWDDENCFFQSAVQLAAQLYTTCVIFHWYFLPVVEVQGETRLARASIRSPDIDTTVFAQSWRFSAFVNVLAHITPFPEALFTSALVRTHRVDAFCVPGTCLQM